jgi:hypothetical protein
MQVRYFLNEAKRYARRRPELIRALENLETDLLLHEASKGRHGAGVDFAFVERIG